MPKVAHADEALLESRAQFEMQVDAECIELFFVLHKGRRVAGGVINYEQKLPRLRYPGILDGSPKVRDLGVLPALNIFRLEHAMGRGFTAVDLGGNRAFSQ